MYNYNYLLISRLQYFNLFIYKVYTNKYFYFIVLYNIPKVQGGYIII